MFSFPRWTRTHEGEPVSLSRWIERRFARAHVEGGARVARRECIRFLRRARRAERGVRGLAGVARVGALAMAALSVAFALDLAVAPAAGTRLLAVLALGGAGVAATLAVLAQMMMRGASDRWLARVIEARWPELDGRLLAIVSYEGRESAAVDTIAPGVARALEKVYPRDVPDRGALRESLLAALGTSAILAAVIAAYAAFAPDRLGRAIALEGEPATAGGVKILAVRPGAARVVEGHDLEVSVGAEGEPREAFVVLRGADKRERRVALERQACGRFSGKLPALSDDAVYSVVLDDVRSGEYPVTLVRAPRVVAVAHAEELPEYLGEEPREVAGGDVDAIEGTRVVVKATAASEPLRGRLRATWTDDGLIETIPLVPSGRTLEGAFTAKRNGSYRIEYEDATGLAPRPSGVFTVAVRPDLPPRVDVLAPAADKEIAYGGSLEIEYEARDDHGLGDLALHVVVHGGKPHKLPLAVSDPRATRGKVTVSPKQLGLLPGDSAIYYVVAQDKKSPIANRAASAPFVLAVEDDARLRAELTGIETRDEDLFRAVENEAGTKEGDEEIARNQEALRRLERILSHEPDDVSGEDILKDLTPEDAEDMAKALDDLEQQQDSVMSPTDQQGQQCPDCDKAAKDAGPCPKCGRKGKCGTCGKPGHGRGCEAARGTQTAPGAGDRRGPPAAGKGGRGEQSKEAIEGARKTLITRVGSSRELTKIYRELLERRRELLRRLADQIEKGQLPPDAVAKLGPDGARVLEALRNMTGKGLEPALGSVAKKIRSKPGSGPPPRTLKVRADIPADAVDLKARCERSVAAPSGQEPSRAADWDESLPEDMRAVVKAYFRR